VIKSHATTTIAVHNACESIEWLQFCYIEPTQTLKFTRTDFSKLK